MSRLQRGVLDLDVADVDLAALVDRRGRSRAHHGAARSGSSLTLEAPPPVRGQFDASRVDQIVTNLLSNAVKYGRGKPITVRLAVVSDEAGSRAEINVRDEGIGIAPVDQERIFERFERAVSRTHYSGLGLGLWISRRIAGDIGGALTVESDARARRALHAVAAAVAIV